MNSELKTHGLSHLQDQPDAEEGVLVVDFDTLSVIDAVASNVSEWGFRLTSPDIGELYKNIGVRTKEAGKLIKAQVTSVKGVDAAVVFAKNEKSVSDKRREKRNSVSIPVKIADFDGITEISGTIVDAGKNGVRITAKGLTALPEEVLLTLTKFEKPVVAEFAWRNETSAGMRLLWDRTLEQNEENVGAEDAEATATDLAAGDGTGTVSDEAARAG
mgnify:CR=1 FL=1